MAAASRTVTGTTRMSGHQHGAPAVTGCVALLLAEAGAQGRSLTCQEIRDIVISTARRDPPAGAAWDDRYGAGRVSASGMPNSCSASSEPRRKVDAVSEPPEPDSSEPEPEPEPEPGRTRPSPSRR